MPAVAYSPIFSTPVGSYRCSATPTLHHDSQVLEAGNGRLIVVVGTCQRVTSKSVLTVEAGVGVERLESSADDSSMFASPDRPV